MKDLESENASNTSEKGTDSVNYNTNNLKVNDRFKSKGFIGEIIVTAVFESYFKVKMIDGSGDFYYASHTLVEFNQKIITGDYYSLVRS